MKPNEAHKIAKNAFGKYVYSIEAHLSTLVYSCPSFQAMLHLHLKCTKEHAGFLLKLFSGSQMFKGSPPQQ
jgi:hypothetical protein